MLKLIANVALAVELSTLCAVAVFLVATVTGQSATSLI
jgi:hypothetical protein